MRIKLLNFEKELVNFENNHINMRKLNLGIKL